LGFLLLFLQGMKKIITLLIISITNFSVAQNLLYNPSLEKFNLCPNFFNQISYADFWSAGCEYGNNDEYFNCCSLDSSNVIPFISYPLTTLKPRTGCGECGLVLYYTSSSGAGTSQYREVVTTKFKTKLVINNCYSVSFYVLFYGFHSNCFSGNTNILNYATNKISALVSSDSIIYPTVGFTDLYQLDPQINYYGPVLNDTVTWVKIEGDFIAQGNEQWIHISSFIPDDSVSVYILPSLTSQVDSSSIGSYYLIDDVAVYPCNAPVYVADAGKDTCVNTGKSITIGTIRRNEYLYWWYDAQGNLLDTTAQITVYPTQTTTYTLVQKDFKFDETRDTVTVTVDAHCNEVANPEIRIPNVISPNGDGINDKFVIENGKFYSMKLNIFNRWGNQIFESNDYQNNWPASDIADGVYFYILTSTNPKQEVKEYKGSVSVVR